MRIGILGSGLMGSKLGTIFARLGHDVVFSYARDRKKLEQLARDAGDDACAGTPKEASARADLVLLAVPWLRVDDVLEQAGPLSGKTVLTCCLPTREDESRLVLGRSDSGAEALARKIPDAHVVSAFTSIPSEVLFAVFERGKKKRKPPDLVYCGDHKRSKTIVAGLIRGVGFNPVDLGALSFARFIEPFALLVAHLAYDDVNSPALAYRFERFAEKMR